MILEVDSQAIFVGAGAVVGLLGVAAALWMARSASVDEPAGDIEKIVRDAPYDRLHNIIPVKPR